LGIEEGKKKWVENYAEGIADYLAKSKGETPEEVEEEKKKIFKIILEKIKDGSLEITADEWKEKYVKGIDRALEEYRKKKMEEEKKKFKEEFYGGYYG